MAGKCRVCEGAGYDTPATRKDRDDVPFCDDCWFDALDIMDPGDREHIKELETAGML